MSIRKGADETKFSAKNLKEEAEKVKKEMASKAGLLGDYKTNAATDKSKAQTVIFEKFCTYFIVYA